MLKIIKKMFLNHVMIIFNKLNIIFIYAWQIIRLWWMLWVWCEHEDIKIVILILVLW